MSQQQLIFNTGKQYLDKGEHAIIAEFVAKLPVLGAEYHKGTGPKKEIRLCQIFRFPLGAITNETELLDFEEDGTRNYTTPNARMTFKPGEKKEPKVWYRDLTDNTPHVTTASEWMKWAETAVCKSKDKKTISKEAQDRLAILKIRNAQGNIDAPLDFAHVSKEEVQRVADSTGSVKTKTK